MATSLRFHHLDSFGLELGDLSRAYALSCGYLRTQLGTQCSQFLGNRQLSKHEGCSTPLLRSV